MRKDDAVVALAIFGIVFFFIGVLIGSGETGVKLSDIVGAISTLIAAYAGAHAAFAFQQRKAEEELRRNNIAGANRFLSKYFLQFNMLLQAKKDWVSCPGADGPAPHISMPANAHLDIDVYKANIQDIDFLLEPRTFEVYFKVILELDRAKMAIDMLNKRSELVINVVQPKLELAGVKHQQQNDVRYIEDILGPVNTEMLKSYTQAAIDHINDGIESMLAAKKGLRDELLKIYPKTHFLDFEKP